MTNSPTTLDDLYAKLEEIEEFLLAIAVPRSRLDRFMAAHPDIEEWLWRDPEDEEISFEDWKAKKK